jgi:hypothetical protein
MRAPYQPTEFGIFATRRDFHTRYDDRSGYFTEQCVTLWSTIVLTVRRARQRQKALMRYSLYDIYCSAHYNHVH